MRSVWAFVGCLVTMSVGWQLMSVVADAAVSRFEIVSREPFADGKEFGDVGAYERIVGRVYFRLDPRLAANRAVVDLGLAKRGADGLVELHSDLFILAPKDSQAGNGAILYDVNNRGNKLALRFFNFAKGTNDPVSLQDAGDGFLLRHGFTLVWSGWDGELLPGNDRLQLAAPLAREGDSPITGLVRCEIVPGKDVTRSVVNWANHGSYRPTERGVAEATLTHRERSGDKRVVIPRNQWTLYVEDVESGASSQLPKVELDFPAGLRKGHIYELIYEARDPLVQGTGFTAVRDLIAALKSGAGRDNPLASSTAASGASGVLRSPIERAYAFGVSQSGRFLREFLYWGFNADEQGNRVFDGVIPHVSGAGLGSFNHRFAQPTRHATQHDHHDYPPDRFPFAYEPQLDPLSGRSDGILVRSTLNGSVPWILHTQSAAEFWTRSGSLTITDPLGQNDAVLPDKVRVYFFGGTQHGPSGFPPQRGNGQNLANPADYRPFLRCLILALDATCRGRVSLPPSVYPTIRSVTLVEPEQRATGFPSIPGVRYPEVIQRPPHLDFGPRWLLEGIIDRQPPQHLGVYRVLVPRCDLDGNVLGCLSPPEVVVPVGTYTGWNLRNADAGAENELLSLTGSYIPFPLTERDRERARDPRPSLAARYDSLSDYVKRLERSCRELHFGGYLLEQDVGRIVKIQTERVQPLFEKIAAQVDD